VDLELVSTSRNCLDGMCMLSAKRMEWAQLNEWVYMQVLQTKHALVRAKQGYHAILTCIEPRCSSNYKAIATAYTGTILCAQVDGAGTLQGIVKPDLQSGFSRGRAWRYPELSSHNVTLSTRLCEFRIRATSRHAGGGLILDKKHTE
jgi:hypothetical protein